LKLLEELLQDATAGDPISGLKWTHRSLRKIAAQRRGVRLSPRAVHGCAWLPFASDQPQRVAGIRDPRPPVSLLTRLLYNS
jgi:hypothetical protein